MAASRLQLLNHLQRLARQKHASVAGSLPHRYFISKYASNEELVCKGDQLNLPNGFSGTHSAFSDSVSATGTSLTPASSALVGEGT
jgi:hypothetical protein